MADKPKHEHLEAMWRPGRGEQGEQGERGEQGEPGKIPRNTRRALAYLFVLMFVLTALNLGWSWHLSMGQHAERCTLIQKVVAIPVPQPVAGNPSRKAFSELVSAFRVRGDQLGCF